MSNGLVTLVTETPARQRGVVVVYLRTGSRFESPAQNGLSHFLEHMLFRGTREYPSAHRLATAFEEWGGTLDATTAADHGTLGIDVPEENLPYVFPLLAEVFQNPLLDDIDIERGVIREEILEDLDEDGKLLDPPSLVRHLAFGSAGLGQPITGPLANIERFTRDDLRAHHERTYTANDTIVSVAGPRAATEVQRQLEETFGKVKRGTSLVATSPEAQSEPRFLFAKHAGTSQTTVTVGFRCPGAHAPLEPAVDMLMRVIDDGLATRLYHELCDKRGLCYSVSGNYETFEDTGLVELEAETAHERAPVVLETILEVADALCAERISDEEFGRLQKRTRWQHKAYLDQPGACADFFALAALSNTAKTPSERLEQLLSVTRDDIRDAAAQVFSRTGRSIVCVGDASKKALEAISLR